MGLGLFRVEGFRVKGLRGLGSRSPKHKPVNQGSHNPRSLNSCGALKPRTKTGANKYT